MRAWHIYGIVAAALVGTAAASGLEGWRVLGLLAALAVGWPLFAFTVEMNRDYAAKRTKMSPEEREADDRDSAEFTQNW